VEKKGLKKGPHFWLLRDRKIPKMGIFKLKMCKNRIKDERRASPFLNVGVCPKGKKKNPPSSNATGDNVSTTKKKLQTESQLDPLTEKDRENWRLTKPKKNRGGIPQ